MTLIQDCPRCGTHGLRPDQPCDPNCRMCLGDGAIVTGHGLVAYEIARQAITDHHAGNAHLTRLIDHTEPDHRCARCSPTQPAHAPSRWAAMCALGLLAAVLMALTVRDFVLLLYGTLDKPIISRLSVVVPIASLVMLVLSWLASRAVTR